RRVAESFVSPPVIAVVYGAEAETAASDESPVRSGVLRSRRVLVVEDNPDAAAVLTMMLKEWGQETRVAGDGPAALEAAREFRPEVILLELGLPKLHGYEVAHRLRHEPWRR